MRRSIESSSASSVPTIGPDFNTGTGRARRRVVRALMCTIGLLAASPASGTDWIDMPSVAFQPTGKRVLQCPPGCGSKTYNASITGIANANTQTKFEMRFIDSDAADDLLVQIIGNPFAESFIIPVGANVTYFVTFSLHCSDEPSTECAVEGEDTATVSISINGSLPAGIPNLIVNGSLDFDRDHFIQLRFEEHFTGPNLGGASNATFGCDDCRAGRGAVPTVSEWGLVAMTLLVLTAGTIVFGRYRLAVV